jgi:hypothetical protein
VAIIIKSETSITVDGEDYKTLSDICEVARILMAQYLTNHFDVINGEGAKERMLALMQRVYDRE